MVEYYISAGYRTSYWSGTNPQHYHAPMWTNVYSYGVDIESNSGFYTFRLDSKDQSVSYYSDEIVLKSKLVVGVYLELAGIELLRVTEQIHNATWTCSVYDYIS